MNIAPVPTAGLDDGTTHNPPDRLHTGSELLERLWDRGPGDADDPRRLGGWRRA